MTTPDKTLGEMAMKCLSLHQPWAHAILHLGKNVENRTWTTRFRGMLLIHAAKSLASLEAQDPLHWRRVYGTELPERRVLTFGALVGVVQVIDCVRVGRGGDIGRHGHSVWVLEGGYAWILETPRAFAEPIDYRGAQQLFDVPDSLIPAEFRDAA